MKTFTLLLAIICCISAYAQDKSFIIEGKTIGRDGQPIADVYVINPRTLEKDITRTNGIFKITVNPQDSLIFSHISYTRISVQIYRLLQNPQIILESDDVQIPEVVVSSEQKSDLKRAEQNLQFLDEYKPILYKRMEPEIDATTTIMTENNRLMRTEASSVSILRIPLDFGGKNAQKRKKNKRYKTDYYSTRKVKKPPIDSIPDSEEDN
ncbi:hypothetical protein SLH46_16860 [Draconibacterium sp. IB214405]|uniref:hypothetical protein n=1 Tax=Draconibacterium sp. IB214405 TaxID=3097352 RepID=UPI002A12EE64|nr:hypothetical protein [Draconibacterium sp. IB214405]MDX8340871.1 hypothetical protein [Draconibacterium sp. IB214405]